ncbi:MAG TPA: DUF6174 domain-containing protein [Longimicrobiaceae bacterium]|jgi:hypothetical protein|nr:DUF6174 domain-containing protein [Longimicrobiaceae bacterium]
MLPFRRRPGFDVLLALPLTLGLVVTACSLLEPGGLDGERAALQRARLRWESRHVGTYSFVLYRGCECLASGVMTVKVVNGTPVSATRPDGTPVPLEYVGAAATVPGLFQLEEDAIERNAFQFSATYDSALGFPQAVSIDYDRNTVDDEVGYTIQSLTVANGAT